eukprot:TRINITY_DN932_c0_g2_i1.p1 TRINITY_DN932_c0_g2~~TRINITY_DN932_c0_g2_i1.p1  ORF type:complete len:216 (+),score=45.79 TRINITY_DN932_c0_g2_i1:34-681(+)
MSSADGPPLMEFPQTWQHALHKIAMRGAGEGVVWCDDEILIMHDKYPKSTVHLLVLPRKHTLVAIDRLTCEDIPLLRRMEAAAWWWLANSKIVQKGMRFASGYHAVPSMMQMHLHVFSTDMLKLHSNVRHYNTFTTAYLRPTEDVQDELEETGRVIIPDYAASHYKPMIHLPPVCNRVGCIAAFKNTKDLHHHLLGCDKPLPGKTVGEMMLAYPR